MIHHSGMMRTVWVRTMRAAFMDEGKRGHINIHKFPVARAAALLVLPTVLACSEMSVEPDTGFQETFARNESGHVDAVTRVDGQLLEVARALALSMGHSEFRMHVHGALDASSEPEQKIRFNEFIEEAPEAVRRRLSGHLTTSRQGALQPLLDSLPQLEIYLPVVTHRKSWKGSSNVIVGTLLTNKTAIAYDTEARFVTLSPSAPPPRTRPSPNDRRRAC